MIAVGSVRGVTIDNQRVATVTQMIMREMIAWVRSWIPQGGQALAMLLHDSGISKRF
jgi:hypothetical protein